MTFSSFKRRIRFLFLLVILSLFFLPDSWSQVNTEKFRKYYTRDGFLYNLRSTFAVRGGNSEYGSMNFAGRIDHNGKKFDQFLVANFEYKSTSSKQISNNGFIHLRGMWNVRKRTNLEFFLQREYDRFVDLNSRSLGGTSIKYQLVDNINSDSTKSFFVNVSTGIMYEDEIYASEPENIQKNLMRSTNFISLDLVLKEKLNLNGIFYYQPAFNNLQDYRFASWLTIDFAIAKRFYFVFQIWAKYNSLPVNDKKPYDFSIENGIRFEFP